MKIQSELVIVLIIGLVFNFFVGSALENYFCKSFKCPNLNNRKCRNHLLWTVNQTRESQCFLKCLGGGEGCQAVFYNEITSNCQGHSTALTDLDDCFDEEGSKYYHKCTSKKPRNCQEIMCAGQHITGIYTIYPDDDSNGVNVRCDMDTDGGGWTVFQRRMDGSVDFNRSWAYYKSGFGNANTENWLGLDNIHKLTSQGNVTLRVDLITLEPPEQSTYAVYSKFTVGDEASKYILTVTGYSGNAGDAMGYRSGFKFTTTDNNNVLNSTNCARDFCGGFWYKSCDAVSINCVYGSKIYGMGVIWALPSGFYVSMTYTEMKLR